MKIEVAKPDLSAALQVATIGTTSSGTDITAHFVFRLRKDGRVDLLSHNSRIGISVPIAGCKVQEDPEGKNAFTVASWRLSKWITAVDNAVLTLNFDNNEVSAKSTRGQVKFESLDPSNFPTWENTFNETPTGIKVSAKRFHAALSHARLFISDKDTTVPHLASTEVRNQSLRATDKVGLIDVTMLDLQDSNLRIHGKDIGSVLSFLSTCGDEEVELRECHKCLFLVRPDGAVMTVGRPTHEFPDVPMDKKAKDPFWWVLKVDDLQSAIAVLAAAAPKEDHNLNFVLKDGMVQLSMKSSSPTERSIQMLEAEHGEEPWEEPDPKKKTESKAVPPTMPGDGFSVSYPHLVKLLTQWRGETIRFGLNPRMKNGKPQGGYIQFREERDKDEYVTMLVWTM